MRPGMAARLEATLARGRAMAEARMGAANSGSDGVVRRKGGRLAQNETTGSRGHIWDVVHTGPFRLAGAQRGSSGFRAASLPGGELQVANRRADWPHDVDMLCDGDLIEVTAGENAGTVWKILEADHADQQTARRMPVVSVTRPEEWDA